MKVAAALAAMCALGALAAAGEAAGSAQVDAARSRGLAWMLTHQRADGSWRGPAGSEFVATATAIEALEISGVKSYPYAAGVAWLGNAHPSSVDSLARQVIATATAGLDVTSAAETLRAWRNPSFGWGAYARYDTTFPDTALALTGLRLAQLAAPDSEIEAALCLVASAQNAGEASVHGSWSYVRPAGGTAPPSARGAIVPTVYNLLEIDATSRARGWTSLGSCAGTTYGVATIVDAGLAWLLSTRRHADGGFGDGGVSEVLETALVYRALTALRPNDAATAAALDFLVERQRQDGSWSADVLHTATVLAALPSPAAALADSDRDGVPDTVETSLPTDPNVPDSRWLARGRNARQVPTPGAANDFGLVAIAAAAGAATTASDSDGSPTGVAAGTSSPPSRPDPLTLGVPSERFGLDPLTGAARVELPLVVPVGAGRLAPSLTLRYDSGAVDELAVSAPAAMTGLGWTLDVGPVIVRDPRDTVATADDAFTLLRDGARHDLVVVDAAASLYRTRDDTFVRLEHDRSADAWTLTTKDGVVWRMGSTAASRTTTLGPDRATPVTRAYHVDEMRTPSGVSVRHTYTKQPATLPSGQTYDQAIYPATMAWASVGGAPVGTPREVTFTYGDRSDWPADAGTPAFVDRQRLESLTIRVGTAVVRTYVFAYDHSIDRDPGAVWAGGATGDLTLVALTMVGGDGATVSPVATFTYTPSGRLASARNALGGVVRYGYERLVTTPLYSVCSAPGCADRGVCDDPDPWGTSTVLGHLLSVATADAGPIYSTCRSGALTSCGDWSLGAASDGTHAIPLGYALSPTAPAVAGTIPLYRNCGTGSCAGSTAPNSGELLGYVYTGALDRHRVATRTLDDGRGGVATTTYGYTEPVLDAAGRFRGYVSVRQIDPVGTMTDTWFLDDDGRAGRAYRVQVRAGDGALYRDITHDWAAVPTVGAATAALLARTRVAACDGEATCRTTAEEFEYDAHGNRTRVRSLGDVAVSGDERDEWTDWVVNATAWIHQPARVALQDASGAVVRERWLAYDGLAWGAVGTRGVLTRDERRLAGAVGAAGNAVTTHEWDAYGNRVSVTDPAGCTSTTSFDDDRAHPVAVTTCLGHTTTFAYDAGTGAIRETTDGNGATTTYAHDGLGRLTRVTGPLDTASASGSTTWEYLDLGSPTIQRIVTYRTREHGTALTGWLEDSFDGQGRVYRQRAPAPGGQSIVTERVFDPRGLVTDRSAPYGPGEAPAWTRATYDALGRVTQVTYPDERRLTTSYTAGVDTTTDARGIVRRRHVDAYGRIVRLEETAGTETLAAAYAWNAAGDLTGISDSVGRVWILRRDALGRLTELTTPNRGTSRYRYDARGSLVARVDAAGRTVAFGYDLAGRLVTRHYPDGARVEWVYDEPNAAAPYTMGRLTRVNDLATSTTFTYDAAGRVIRASRLLDGDTYATSYTYDAQGRVTSRTDPDGETVTYRYDDAGRLAAIPGYLTAIAYNARGQRTRIDFANGATTTLAYYDQAADRRHHRLKWLTTSSGGARVQALGFTYDDAGHLVRIVDTLGTAGRIFTYDLLGRLVGTRAWPDGAFEEYRYDVTGNLVIRGAAVYAYADAAHPSAVSATSDGRDFVYDADGYAGRAGTLTLARDLDGRLQRVSAGAAGAVTYDYDADGRPVRRTTPAGVTRMPFPDYLIDPFGVAIKRVGPVTRTSTGDVMYRHADQVERTHVVTDARGARRRLVEYGPWGDVTRLEGAPGDIDWLADRAASGTRLYDATLGRFLDADAEVRDLAPLQALNEYSYAANNPATPPGFAESDP